MTSADCGPGEFLSDQGEAVLFRNAPVGMCLLRDRRILSCNRKFEEIFGYGTGELENQSVELLYPSNETFTYIGEKYGHFFEKHTLYLDERPLLRKDKTMIWCIVTGRVLVPGNPRLGAVWVVQDISEHKDIETKLKENIEMLELLVAQRTVELRDNIDTLNIEVETRKKAEEIATVSQHKYQTLFHMLPIGISLTTEDGKILEANPAFCEMVGVDDAVSMNWRDLPGRFFLHDGSKISKKRFAWMIAEHQQRKVGSVEVGMLPRRGETPRWFSTNTSLLHLRGERIVVVVATDITYRKRIEELERLRYAELTRLARINSMAEMATTIAHQLGQPLVSSLNYLNGCRLRLQQGRSVDEIAQSIDLAIDGLEQAGEVLRRVRDFVCKHTPEKTPEDINQIIRESAQLLEFESRRHRVDIRLELNEAVPLVPLNKLEIQQVLFNLLKNGMEAMASLPEDQRVLTVGNRISRDGTELRVFVVDRGSGIGSAYAERLFDPLFTTKPDGIGMGLTICRCIIESHGGKLCFSKTEKQGSKFQFSLPMTRVGHIEGARA